MNSERKRPDWPLSLRIVFRFIAAYLVLYNFPFPVYSSDFVTELINKVPGVSWCLELYGQLWKSLDVWLNDTFIHVEAGLLKYAPQSGSNDNTAGYVRNLGYCVAALAITVVTMPFDFWRRDYRRIHGWLRIYVRFFLAVMMFQYGAAKVIPSQFPYPSLDRLIQPFGDASPMGLLWTFMGASKGYNLFTGAGEMIGGLLLTTRRTTLLGALVTAGIMAQVVTLNFCYDVPVKLFSTNLLLMALFLIAPDAHRLLKMFVFNQPVPPSEIPPLFPGRWTNVAVICLRTLIVGYFIWEPFSTARETRQKPDLSSRSPYYGLWTVEECTCDGKDEPPRFLGERWRRVIFEGPLRFAVQTKSDHVTRFWIEKNENDKRLTFNSRSEPIQQWTITIEQPQTDVLILEGEVDGQWIHAKLRKEVTPEFLLKTRGFHWISEQPYNR